MSFAGVTWAYKDVITSAKLAQMVENVRTHDHYTTDQGARIGLLDDFYYDPAPDLSVNSTAATVIADSVHTITIPTGIASSRRLVSIESLGVAVGASGTSILVETVYAAGGSLGGSPSNFAYSRVQYPISAGYHGRQWILRQALGSISGTYTFGTRITFSAASASNVVFHGDRLLFVL